MTTMPSPVEFTVSSELEKFILSHEFLRPGDKLTGKVIDIKGNGKTLIDFVTFRALADIKFPVKVGESIPVVVDSKGSQLKFRLDLPQQDFSPGQARSIINKLEIPPEKVYSKIQAEIQRVLDSDNAADVRKLPQIIKEALSRVGRHFEPLDAAGSLLKSVELLKTHIRKSGIFFEKELETAIHKLTRAAGKIPDARGLARMPQISEILTNDLKPNLLVLRQYLGRPEALREASDIRQLETLRRTVDDLLDNITNQQEGAVEKQARQPADRDPLQMFQFNLPVRESEQNARLKVYYSRKDKETGKKSFRLSLLLNMARLGDIRTDFLLRENDLNITFFVKNHNIRDRIETGLGEIREPLDGMFDYLVLKVYVSEKKITQFDTEDLEMPGSRILDVKV